MTQSTTNWKTYLKTGATATLAIAVTHTLAYYTNASCADKWTTLGTAGALGSFVGAYQAQGGSVLENLRAWKSRLLEKKA